MKACWRRLTLLGLSIASVSVLMWAGVASAQSSDNAVSAGIASAMVLFIVVFALGAYIYMALALQTIANKTGTINAWLAWIPIANLILMLNVAKKPMWWIILLLIPVVGLVVGVIVWMAIAEARHKPSWWGIMLIVPLVNFVVPGYLAWAD
jgi:Family of unknown function (DUF5684)